MRAEHALHTDARRAGDVLPATCRGTAEVRSEQTGRCTLRMATIETGLRSQALKPILPTKCYAQSGDGGRSRREFGSAREERGSTLSSWTPRAADWSSSDWGPMEHRSSGFCGLFGVRPCTGSTVSIATFSALELEKPLVPDALRFQRQGPRGFIGRPSSHSRPWHQQSDDRLGRPLHGVKTECRV